MGELIGNVQKTLDKANTELAALKDDGKYELMQKLLDKDSSEYGEFFPVIRRCLDKCCKEKTANP